LRVDQIPSSVGTWRETGVRDGQSARHLSLSRNIEKVNDFRISHNRPGLSIMLKTKLIRLAIYF
jgi:hypothetical protein